MCLEDVRIYVVGFMRVGFIFEIYDDLFLWKKEVLGCISEWFFWYLERL